MSDKYDKGDLFEGDELTVTIKLENNTEIECIVLNIFEVDTREYIAVLPEDEECEDVYLYRYTQKDDGEPELTNIESDEEYEAVVDAFEEILDMQEFEEFLSEDDDFKD